jgi:hypothetical protein
MRKDEIETRIIKIEQSLRDLEAMHRDQGTLLLSEIRSFQGLFMDEKIESMRRQVIQGHQRLLLDLVIATIGREFGSVCPDPCSLYNRDECIEFFTCRLRESAERMDPDEAEEYIANQIRQDEELVKKYPELGREPCLSCYRIYLSERDHLMKGIGELTEARSLRRRHRQMQMIRDLPEEEVIATIIEPLSHPVRFRMIKGLSRGGMSYSELSALTGYKGGHLLFHITRLAEADLIVKDGSSGMYLITDQGIRLIDLIRKLFSEV